jgi:hypothetical protein
MIMTEQEKPSADRRKVIGVLAVGAAAVLAATVTPLRVLTGKRRTTPAVQSTVTITPNPMAVQRTSKGAAHNG